MDSTGQRLQIVPADSGMALAQHIQVHLLVKTPFTFMTILHYPPPPSSAVSAVIQYI